MAIIQLSRSEAFDVLGALEAADTVIRLLLSADVDEAERKAADARIDVGDAIPLLQSKFDFPEDSDE